MYAILITRTCKKTLIFPFICTQGYCYGFHDVLETYNQITPNLRLSGGTNFAPVINKAIDIVKHERTVRGSSIS